MASNQDRGYIVDVISENEKKKFECMLCLAIIKKATHGCKKHVFCQECIHDYIKSIERREEFMPIRIKCPSGCGQTFNKNELISNDYADQLINQISCRCKDCDWRGELIDFVQVHAGKCIEKEVPCPLCGMAFKRKSLNHHMKDECTHRRMVCRGCRKNFPFVDHLKHEESCDDIKVECSFTKYGCNVQDTRKNMITHENNSNKQHMSLIEKYVTDENKQLKEETKQLKEENKQFKEENTQLKEETIQLKEETKQLKEETKQLKDENNQLKEKVKILTWKVNIPKILLTEPANNIFYFPAADEMHIRDIYSVSPPILDYCGSKSNFTSIIEDLTSRCDVLKNYKEELHKLFSTTKTIKFGCLLREYYFFHIDDFKDYKCENFSVKKSGNIFYIYNNYCEKYNNYRDMWFYISKWQIQINKYMTKIDIMKPDERFEECMHRRPRYLPSKYFCVWY